MSQFVTDNFDPADTEFQPWDPQDWNSHPEILDKIEVREMAFRKHPDQTLPILFIQDSDYKLFAEELNQRWKDLGRKIKPELADSERSTLIYLEHPFIVPGGRFREVYYWDSYWTILGLLQSEMTSTTKGTYIMKRKIGHSGLSTWKYQFLYDH